KTYLNGTVTLHIFGKNLALTQVKLCLNCKQSCVYLPWNSECLIELACMPDLITMQVARRRRD
ncbi:hypothetical protein, partial [Paraburkholderia oxyphila]|uniref:hypothetical protein n=1 Tax=Paraburkholderia oxyphila TaxID=614212 RepID=UPI001C3F2CCC